MTKVCEEDGMPTPDAVYDWIDADPSGERQKRYEECRQRQAEIWSDQIIDIADDSSGDTLVVKLGNKEFEKPNREWIERTKVRVNTRTWLMARVHAKRWGDTVPITLGSALSSAPLLIGVNIFRDSPATALAEPAKNGALKTLTNGNGTTHVLTS